MFGSNSAFFVCESVNKVNVFAHKDSLVTADGVFLFFFSPLQNDAFFVYLV